MRYLNSTNLLSIFLFSFLMPFTGIQELQAQSTSLSPYSRFGLGDIHNQAFAEQSGMAGLNAVFIDPLAINPGNPASYAFTSRPTFGLGARVQLLSINTETQSQFVQNNTINNIAFAFPMAKNKLGVAFGLMPFSSLGYNIAQDFYNEELEQQMRLEYNGDGGITRAFLGAGYKLFNKVDTLGNLTNFSAGLNVSLLFGSLNEVRKSIFPGGYGGFNFRVEDKYRMADVSFDLGLNYSINLKKLKEGSSAYTRLIVGATFRVPKNLGVNGSRLAETYALNSSTNIETSRDTVSYQSYGKGKVFLPAAYQLGGGLEIVNEKARKFFVGIEYRLDTWSDFSNNFSTTNNFNALNNSHHIVAGGSYQPTVKSSRNVMEKMHYRMGARYEQSYITLKDEQLSSYGISFGLGVPIALKRLQSPSTFNIGVEWGQRGTTANNLIREDVVNISLGLTLMPHFRQGWFVQRKYD
jgi:hypothetical protein